jgi:hypothetical protein
LQNIKAKYSIPVTPYITQGKGSKLLRAKNIESFLALGNVYLPKNKAEIGEFIHEHLMFPNGKNDDMVDTTVMAIQMLLQNEGDIVYSEFDESVHTVDEDKQDKSLVYLAINIDEMPVAVFIEIRRNKQVFVHKIYYSETRMEQFVDKLRDIIQDEYQNNNVKIVMNTASSQDDTLKYYKIIKDKLPFRIDYTNINQEFKNANELMSDLLTTNVMDINKKQIPKFVIKKDCDEVIKTFLGGLRFKQTPEQSMFKNKLVKEFPFWNISNCLHTFVFFYNMVNLKQQQNENSVSKIKMI